MPLTLCKAQHAVNCRSSDVLLFPIVKGALRKHYNFLFRWLFVEHRQNVRQQRRNAAMLKKEIADCEPRSEVDPDTTKEKLMSLS